MLLDFSALGTRLIEAVEEKGLAIGQLFRHLSIMPTFELRDAGVVDVGAQISRKAGDEGAALGSDDGLLGGGDGSLG